MRRIHHRLAWSAIVATLFVWPATADRVLPWGDAPPPVSAGSDTAQTLPQAPTSAERLREGSVLKDLPGTFQSAGDRISFCPSDREAALPVLENLALERVSGMLENAGGRVWSVSGTVTEFRGRNYLLISRAVVRTQRAAATTRP